MVPVSTAAGDAVTGRPVIATLMSAAVTETQAPVVEVPPPAAVFAIATVIFVVTDIAEFPLVLFACGHVP
jgi:hypothetical protein